MPHAIHWEPRPAAADFVRRQLDELLRRAPRIQRFAQRVHSVTGTCLVDWVDEIHVPADVTADELVQHGFLESARPGGGYRNEQALLPVVRIAERVPAIVLRVDDVCDFLLSNGLPATEVSGRVHGAARSALALRDAGAGLWVRQRHVAAGVERREDPHLAAAAATHVDAFRRRPRGSLDAEVDFDAAEAAIVEAQERLGEEHACSLFFLAERDFWQRRNRAARLQRARHDELGLGWGAVDHYTYRSSRSHFARLIRVLQLLGLECRERFHAGAEAGWGAQVMEHAGLGIAVFADVDLAPEEVAGDFAHSGLDEVDGRGTVGSWCMLHGEAFCGAGLHHIARQGDFARLIELSAAGGVECMAPFASLPYLQQCFTRGEVWSVSEQRLRAARAAGVITDAQVQSLSKHGAIGSHLELIERGQGYRGFLQRGISDIIQRTDPRNAAQ